MGSRGSPLFRPSRACRTYLRCGICGDDNHAFDNDPFSKVMHMFSKRHYNRSYTILADADYKLELGWQEEVRTTLKEHLPRLRREYHNSMWCDKLVQQIASRSASSGSAAVACDGDGGGTGFHESSDSEPGRSRSRSARRLSTVSGRVKHAAAARSASAKRKGKDSGTCIGKGNPPNDEEFFDSLTFSDVKYMKEDRKFYVVVTSPVRAPRCRDETGNDDHIIDFMSGFTDDRVCVIRSNYQVCLDHHRRLYTMDESVCRWRLLGFECDMACNKIHAMPMM